MSKRELPQPGTEEYNKLVLQAALILLKDWRIEDWNDVLLEQIYNYFGEGWDWQIGEHRYLPEPFYVPEVDDSFEDWEPHFEFLRAVVFVLAEALKLGLPPALPHEDLHADTGGYDE
jgi:hypothetical protein